MSRKHGLAAAFRRFLTTNSTAQSTPFTREDFDMAVKAIARRCFGGPDSRDRRSPMLESHPPSWGGE